MEYTSTTELPVIVPTGQPKWQSALLAFWCYFFALISLLVAVACYRLSRRHDTFLLFFSHVSK
jgi:hypothetical protein